MNAVSSPPSLVQDNPQTNSTQLSADDVAARLNQINLQSEAGNFNVNASEFVPKFGLSVAADVFFPQQEDGSLEEMTEEDEVQFMADGISSLIDRFSNCLPPVSGLNV